MILTVPEPSILRLRQRMEMFLYPPSPRACRYIFPCSLLSANTFTFLVLLSNKRGGSSGGLLTLLKQTSMNSHRQGVTLLPAQPVHPPTHTAWPPPHSVGQQCCGLNSQLRSQFLPSNFEVHSQESASPKRLHISILFSLGALKKTNQKLS